MADKTNKCESCLWFIGWAGKCEDFGWYAPCVNDEARKGKPNFTVVYCNKEACEHWLPKEIPSADVQAKLQELHYSDLDGYPSR